MDAVVHFEIPTDDLEQATRFYADVFGWQIRSSEQMDYTLAMTAPVDETTFRPTEPGTVNGGLVPRSAEIQQPVVTIGVASIDDALRQIEAAGGSVVAPRVAIPDFGAYAYFRDTEGNVLGLWEGVA